MKNYEDNYSDMLDNIKHSNIYIYTQICVCTGICIGFPGGSEGKESGHKAEYLGSTPRSRIP